MFYAIWVVGVLAAIWASVTINNKIERKGSFDSE
ncbi:MAG: cytochrome bd oxidase small subunit, CydX/CbdX family [[Actinobacillus] rossii]|uniref:Cyd operon protein YbgT n=1 Tax=[Actinobacillus] rossii TaxID=123820 RepID=A0A380U4M3_9PAST|nr:cytochrome bd oxidase small subunit, CydX/CbdX family [[Actinobacillus] rossii]MDY4505885.1 cytochrome bd oxidase small subunit, CydX/CbdX family [[Actinobacillus] rossii]SUT96106.1 Uncharacterised protein [[Actinobacillus] rossii]